MQAQATDAAVAAAALAVAVAAPAQRSEPPDWAVVAAACTVRSTRRLVVLRGEPRSCSLVRRAGLASFMARRIFPVEHLLNPAYRASLSSQARDAEDHHVLQLLECLCLRRVQLVQELAPAKGSVHQRTVQCDMPPAQEREYRALACSARTVAALTGGGDAAGTVLLALRRACLSSSLIAAAQPQQQQQQQQAAAAPAGAGDSGAGSSNSSSGEQPQQPPAAAAALNGLANAASAHATATAAAPVSQSAAASAAPAVALSPAEQALPLAQRLEQESGKLAVLGAQLQEEQAAGKRCLVVASLPEALALVRAHLTAKGICHTCCCGSPATEGFPPLSSSSSSSSSSPTAGVGVSQQQERRRRRRQLQPEESDAWLAAQAAVWRHSRDPRNPVLVASPEALRALSGGTDSSVAAGVRLGRVDSVLLLDEPLSRRLCGSSADASDGLSWLYETLGLQQKGEPVVVTRLVLKGTVEAFAASRSSAPAAGRHPLSTVLLPDAALTQQEAALLSAEVSPVEIVGGSSRKRKAEAPSSDALLPAFKLSRTVSCAAGTAASDGAGGSSEAGSAPEDAAARKRKLQLAAAAAMGTRLDTGASPEVSAWMAELESAAASAAAGAAAPQSAAAALLQAAAERLLIDSSCDTGDAETFALLCAAGAPLPAALLLHAATAPQRAAAAAATAGAGRGTKRTAAGANKAAAAADAASVATAAGSFAQHIRELKQLGISHYPVLHSMPPPPAAALPAAAAVAAAQAAAAAGDTAAAAAAAAVAAVAAAAAATGLPVTDLVLRPHYLHADADAPLGYALSYLEPKPVSSSSRSSTKSKQKRKGGTAPIGSSSGAAASGALVNGTQRKSGSTGQRPRVPANNTLFRGGSGARKQMPPRAVDTAEEWTAAEDALLLAAVDAFQQSWVLVAFVLNRDPALRGRLRCGTQCKLRYADLAAGGPAMAAAAAAAAQAAAPAAAAKQAAAAAASVLPPRPLRGALQISTIARDVGEVLLVAKEPVQEATGVSHQPPLPVLAGEARTAQLARFQALVTADKNNPEPPQIPTGSRVRFSSFCFVESLLF
jgi:trimeric autotransporter adhesin